MVPDPPCDTSAHFQHPPLFQPPLQIDITQKAIVWFQNCFSLGIQSKCWCLRCPNYSFDSFAPKTLTCTWNGNKIAYFLFTWIFQFASINPQRLCKVNNILGGCRTVKPWHLETLGVGAFQWFCQRGRLTKFLTTPFVEQPWLQRVWCEQWDI